MITSYFMKRDDEGRAEIMEQFRDQIGQFLASLGILPTDPMILQQGLDAAYFRALLTVQTGMQNSAQGWTGWKNYTRDGGAVAVPTPGPFTLAPDFPSAVPPGIITRFLILANRVKDIPACTPAVAAILGLVGAEKTAPDLTTVQPVITANLNAGRVEIGWGWQHMAAFLQQCEIQVDRADGKGFVLLEIDVTPGCVDTAPFPAALTKWTYRAIYRANDQQTGLWSLPVTIIVGG